jgi:hypothetical protein
MHRLKLRLVARVAQFFDAITDQARPKHLAALRTVFFWTLGEFVGGKKSAAFHLEASCGASALRRAFVQSSGEYRWDNLCKPCAKRESQQSVELAPARTREFCKMFPLFSQSSHSFALAPTRQAFTL